MLRERFLCYIRGGKPEGATKTFPGCTDKTLPKADRPIQLPHALYFAKSSSVWDNGGVAFLKAAKNEKRSNRTLGRRYLITSEQFVQVVRQENAEEPEENNIRIDLEKTIKDGQSMINGNWYSRIMYLGNEYGSPIFTFTGCWADAEIVVNAPGEKYLKTIIKGIKETYELDTDCIVRYLAVVEGLQGQIDAELLKKWIRDVV